MATTTDELLQELLDQNSITEVQNLAKTTTPLTETFKKHTLTILKKHIAPEAWHDALACVDRRPRTKKHRPAFDADHQNGALADPENEPHWNLADLCDLVRIVDRLLLHVADVGTVDTPGREHDDLEAWEASWEHRRPDVPDTEEYHPLGDERWQGRDHGTEHPENFAHAFARHVRYNASNDTILGYEGVPVSETTRPRLQRAFFRLEFMRRAYYSRPLFPRGAKWQSRDSTFEKGEAQGLAGETFETRLERAEKIFRGWGKDDFVEIICAFKATLHLYAVPVSEMMAQFAGLVHNATNSWDVRRATEYHRKHTTELEGNARVVGLQWERNPLNDASVLPLWGIRPDAEFRDLQLRLHAEQRDLLRFRMRRLLPLGRGEFDDLGCTIFKTDVIRAAHETRRRGGREHDVLPEALPDEEMSKFFHALCSLPLKFLDRFMDMSTKRKNRFLKTTYRAIARIKASHAPMFLSGEVRAWMSKPADENGGRHWDHEAERRLFPELSVRYAVLACVGITYRLWNHPYSGWLVQRDANQRYSWWWENVPVTPLAWARIRSAMKYRPFDINPVFLMSDQSWQAVWRSSRRYERQFWTGVEMGTVRWEGYGHPGRLDPNECYCHVGEGCALCTPLPRPEEPGVEWELFTEDDWEAEFELEKQLHARAQPLDELIN